MKPLTGFVIQVSAGSKVTRSYLLGYYGKQGTRKPWESFGGNTGWFWVFEYGIVVVS